MRIERLYTPGLAQVAYLVGDEQAGVAALMPAPRRGGLPKAGHANGLRITDVFETHIHADFVSGALELAAATGATIHAGRLGAAAYPHHALADNDEVAVGGLRVRALHTPGHTPEHLCFFVTDPQGEHGGSAAPPALFSGDMLFVGEVGRPDLWARRPLIDSPANSLTPFNACANCPDNLIVYPARRRLGLRQEHRRLPQHHHRPGKLRQLRLPDPDERDAFKRAILEGMPPAPTYYPILKRNSTRPARHCWPRCRRRACWP